jgi:hypothetical protein
MNKTGARRKMFVTRANAANLFSNCLAPSLSPSWHQHSFTIAVYEFWGLFFSFHQKPSKLGILFDKAANEAEMKKKG